MTLLRLGRTHVELTGHVDFPRACRSFLRSPLRADVLTDWPIAASIFVAAGAGNRAGLSLEVNMGLYDYHTFQYEPLDQ